MLDNQESLTTIKPNYTLIIIVGLLILFLMIKDELQKSSQFNAEQKVVDDPNYNLASQLYSAFNISFISTWITTYDEEKVFEVAGKITDWLGVQKAYYDLYKETLISRLQKVFQDSPNKLNLFYAKINQNKGGTTTQNPVIPKAGVLKVGAKTFAVNNTTAFDFTDSRIVLKTYNPSDEVGIYLGDFSTKIKGITYAVVEIPWYYFFTKKALIVKSNLIQY